MTATAERRFSIFGWFRGLTGDAPVFPLIVLFGLASLEGLGTSAFAILLPNIGDAFDLSTSQVLSIVAFGSFVALVAAAPIGFYADRVRRLPIAIAGAIIWIAANLLTAGAGVAALLIVGRAGVTFGNSVNLPTHNSLLADYYDIPQRPKVYSVHRAALAVGAFVGPLVAGLLGDAYGWRVPLVVLTIPGIVFTILAFRLHEPLRGVYEKRAMGAAEETVQTEDVAPSWAESWRVCWNVATLRLIFYALPFLAIAFIGLSYFSNIFYAETFGVGLRDRGFIAAFIEPAQLIGLMAGTPIATRLLMKGADQLPRFAALVGVIVSIAWAGFALSPNLGFAIAMNAVVSGTAVLIIPASFAALSLAIPPKIRSFGFAVAALWIAPGLVALPIVGSLGNAWGIRWGLLVMVPIFLIGAAIIATAGTKIDADIKKVWTSAAAQAEALYERRHGRSKLLLVRGVSVHYDNVQVLFDVDLEVDEGEIIALLGTNGAGKSTLLKAIAGTVEASAGAIVFDGRDMTYTPPEEAAGRGVTMAPGGQGVFPSLTARENLELAAWLRRRDKAATRDAFNKVLEIFPVLRDRLDEPAGNLSGGQQQMLTLGMAFIEKPRLLMIDELSLGLAPAVVTQLLEIVKELKAAGTTIILVEQSVNIALTVAETAYFMEKGEIRFHGATSELLERPDVLRSVFLQGAATRDAADAAAGQTPAQAPTAPVAVGPSSAVAASNGASAATRLEVEEVSKRFGGISALSRVSFEVCAGEILGFIGPNGAGKTTLFDVICGFTPANTGSIVLRAANGDPIDLSRRPAQVRAQLGLGRSFQDGRLFPALTVRETIAVALECSVEVRDPLAAALHLPAVVDSEAAVDERVEELIELMSLGAYTNKFVRELSTGSRRIVDLACVLAHKPSVLLLDEPSSGIAQREAEALGPLLLRIRDQLGASILMIEHDLPLLSSISDRMIALDLGEIIADGPPGHVVHDPAVVASYLGTDSAAIARSGARSANGDT